MRCLVTGAGGFLGASLVETLLEDTPLTIRCLVRGKKDEARLLELASKYPDREGGIETLVGDLLVEGDISRALEGVDLVYHLAAGLTGAPSEVFMGTCVATERLLKGFDLRRPKRAVLVSSFGVYGWHGMDGGALVDESSPLEERPELRDAYSHAKLVQERIFRDYCSKSGVEPVVVRPGVIYGMGGPMLSSRVGLFIGPLFLFLGGKNRLPLTHVQNCAKAVALAGTVEKAAGQTFNVVDDDEMTCREYLKIYRKKVGLSRVVGFPRLALKGLAAFNQWYHRRSKGQLPLVFTAYKIDSSWKGFRFSGKKCREVLGWVPKGASRQRVPQVLEEYAATRAAAASSRERR